MIDSMYSALPALAWRNDTANAAIKEVQDRYGMYQMPENLDELGSDSGKTFQKYSANAEQMAAEVDPQTQVDQGRPPQIHPLQALGNHFIDQSFRGMSPSVFG